MPAAFSKETYVEYHEFNTHSTTVAGKKGDPLKTHATEGYVTNCAAGEYPQFFASHDFVPDSRVTVSLTGPIKKVRVSGAVAYGAFLEVSTNGRYATAGSINGGGTVRRNVAGFAISTGSIANDEISMVADPFVGYGA